MIKRKLPFLLPFIVEAELRSLNNTSTSDVVVPSLQTQIDEHEAELNQMIDGLTASQMESLRTTVEYLWGKSLSQRSVQQINFIEAYERTTQFTAKRH